jgi:hypothetical protein
LEGTWQSNYLIAVVLRHIDIVLRTDFHHLYIFNYPFLVFFIIYYIAKILFLESLVGVSDGKGLVIGNKFAAFDFSDGFLLLFAKPYFEVQSVSDLPVFDLVVLMVVVELIRFELVLIDNL